MNLQLAFLQPGSTNLINTASAATLLDRLVVIINDDKSTVARKRKYCTLSGMCQSTMEEPSSKRTMPVNATNAASAAPLGWSKDTRFVQDDELLQLLPFSVKSIFCL